MQRHGRLDVSHRQVLLIDDLEARKPFQDIECHGHGHDAGRDIGIAFVTARKLEAEGRDLPPELFIAQWVEPLVNIGLIFKVSHAKSVQDRAFRLQIATDKRGKSWS